VLSDHDETVLAGIERRLLIEDPALVRAFGVPPPRIRAADHGWGTDLATAIAGLALSLVLRMGPRPRSIGPHRDRGADGTTGAGG
jgi:hypothetical protein